MLLEMLVEVGNPSTGLDFIITQSLCGMQKHGCVYSVGMSTIKKSTFQLCHVHLSVYSHISAWLPLDVFSWNLMWRKTGTWLILDRNIGHFTWRP